MNITEQLIELVYEHAGVKKEEIKPESFIEEDFGCTGDDAWELMEEIQKKFNVDLNEFEFSLHFGPEAGSYVAKNYGYYPVSVKHLIEVAEDKKWKLPPRNEANYEKHKSSKRKWLVTKLLFLLCFILFIIYNNSQICE